MSALRRHATDNPYTQFGRQPIVHAAVHRYSEHHANALPGADIASLKEMQPSITRHSIQQALLRLLEVGGINAQASDLTVAVTQYDEPALYAVIVSSHLRDALSSALMEITGRFWATHWEVWILNEVDAQKLLRRESPDC
jgi:hypothetical protein